METKATEGGWRRFSGVHGWEGWEIHILATVIDGQPRAIGARIEPVPGSEPVALNSANLRRLPVSELARVTLGIGRRAAEREAKDLKADVAALAELVMGRDPHVDPAVTAAVAEAWKRAHREGRPTTAAVRAEVPMSQRSAARYIARARKAGLIPPSTRGGAKPSHAAARSQANAGTLRNEAGVDRPRGNGPDAASNNDIH